MANPQPKQTNRPRIQCPSFFIGQGGGELISFGSGQPDLPPPQEIYSVLPSFRSFKYGLIQGHESLREALAAQYPSATRESFVITNGASEALDLTFRFIATRGHKVLLPRPYYYSYPFLPKYSGMEAAYYDLKDGKIQMDNFLQNLEGCAAVLINSPSNPTGSIQEVSVLKEIERVTQSRNIYVISDEVYKDLIYERENYLLKGPHVITINSFSKTYAMCGLRIGYLYSTDREVIQSVVEMKNHTSMNTNILGQEMALAAMRAPQEYIHKQTAIWRERRDRIYNGLKSLGLDLWKPEGAFYVFPKMENANQVVNDLYYDYKVIAYDGAWFGCPNRVRFSYALDVEKIETGLERIALYLKNRS